MRRKEQYADEIIKMLERTKGGAWASNINLNTKDRVIEVCQNCVDSWSGRKFKDHCTTPPQALEQTRWIPVSERLPDIHNCFQDCLITNKHKSVYKAFFTDINGKQWWSVDDVIAWCELPQPYKGESEDTE